MQSLSWRRDRLSSAEERRLVEAIARAEVGHRGEIQVFLEARYPGEGPLGRAAALFDALGLTRTRDGTGVLLYVATEDRRVAVWAGPGIHGAAAPGFWSGVAAKVAAGFARGDRAGGIVEALGDLRELLLKAAPGEDRAGQELEDRVIQR
jgi:uncharacterized membrane protein